MEFGQFLLFVPSALLLAIVPGPDNLGVLALALSAGKRASLGFALGCAAGCLNHTLLAAIGVSALIAASPIAFQALQWAGAAYLAWIGGQSLRSAMSGGAPSQRERDKDDHFLPHFRRGLIANAINPKVALFFLALLPQFVRAEGWPAPYQLAVLGTVFGVCAALVFCAIAISAGAIGDWMAQRPRAVSALHGATGILFFGLALRLVGGRSST